MAKDTVRLGLVELHVDLDQRPVDNLASLVRRGAACDRTRAGTVKAILGSRDLADVDVLLFPGWTLTGRTLPKWVVALTGRRTVVIELDEGIDGGEGSGKARPRRGAWPGWTTYLVHRGNAEPIGVRQRFAQSEDATAERCSQLVADLEDTSSAVRGFHDTRLGRVGLLVCGEVNAVSERRHGPNQLPPGFPPIDLVLNPAHTPTRLQAMRSKRRRLSEGAVLAMTANVHSQWNRLGKTGSQAKKAAQVFRDGEEIERDELHAVPLEGGRVLVFELPALGRTMRHGSRTRGARS